MVLLRRLTTALLAVGALSRPGEVVKRASLQQVSSFGDNTSGTLMYIYVPANLATKPAVIVAIHYCTGTAQAYYQGTPYAQLAEQYGFVVIYPQSPYSGTCWDVSSKAALTHNGGADSNSIANMVTWTLNQYKGDSSRVFVTGSSSGAMMTNVMAATYPEMFAAASVYSGVPAGCFYTGTVDGWNATCAQGQIVSTQAYWSQVAENMYPGYSGSRPRMQIYHGTADTTLYPQNYNETIKQWTGVFGYSLTPQQTLAQTPSGPYTKYIFGPNLQGIYGQGIGHTVPVMGTEDMKWFGFAPGEPGVSSTPATTPPATTKTPTSTSASSPRTTTSSAPSSGSTGCQSAHWGQCGGIGWTGCTSCVAGTTCKYSNDWYSQCL